MPKVRLTADASRSVPTAGKFLSIISSTGRFAIESPKFGVVVGEAGRQYEMQDIKQVTFVNNSVNELNIEFEVANIKVHTNGTGVTSISNLPATQQVSFAVGQSVDVGNFPASFNVSNLPAVQAVTIEAGQSVSVGNFPASFSVSNLPAIQAVTIEAGQSVDVGNFPASFSVSNLPAVQAVTIEAGQSVSVGNFPASFNVSNLPAIQAVTIEAGQEISIKPPTGYNPLAPADFSLADVVIAQKAGRDTLIIMAAVGNASNIWVGGTGVGIPLKPGQEFNLGSDAAVTLHAENAADICYLAEVLK